MTEILPVFRGYVTSEQRYSKRHNCFTNIFFTEFFNNLEKDIFEKNSMI